MSFRRGGRGGQGTGSRFSGGPGRDGDNGSRGDAGGAGRPGRDQSSNRLSNHTSDAAMASARIFIGNLPTNDPRLTKEYLEERFICYGQILGMSILKGFGFIQFAEESSAETAIREAQHTDILGHRVDVKHVKSGKDSGSNAGSGNKPSAEPREFSNNYRDRSPLRPREPELPMRGREPDMRSDMNRGRDPGSLGRGPRDFGGREPRDWNRGREMDPFGPEAAMLDHERDMHPRDPYAPPVPMPSDPHRAPNFGGANMGPSAALHAANEVEIIVTSKMGPVRQYAERIENRLKGQGLAVDVLFPHEEIPLRKVLSDLSARGTLFGIVVTPLNQEQGSITLNILFGQPEEHRNMPVEDAFCLLSTAFKRHKSLTGGVGGVGADARQIQIGPDAHPANLQHLINLLQENRPLTVVEYDRLLRYLGERRDRQVMLDMADAAAANHHPVMPSLIQGVGGGGGMNPMGLPSMGAMSTPGGLGGSSVAVGGVGGVGLVGPKSGDAQSELQQRILNILNAGGGGGGGGVGGVVGIGGVAAPQLGGVPAPVPAPHPSASALSWGAAGEVSSTAGGSSGGGGGGGSGASGDGKSMDGLMQVGQPLMKHYAANLPAAGGATNRPMSGQPHNNNSYNPNAYMNKRF